MLQKPWELANDIIFSCSDYNFSGDFVCASKNSLDMKKWVLHEKHLQLLSPMNGRKKKEGRDNVNITEEVSRDLLPCTVYRAPCMHSRRCPFHSTRETVHGPRFTVDGARHTVQEKKCTVYGACCTVHGTRKMMHGARYVMNCTYCTILGTRCTVCAVHSCGQVLGFEQIN